MKKLSFMLSAAMVLGMLPSMVAAQGSGDIPPGKLVKAKSSSAVYYIDADLNRYVFANPHVFFSWYNGFDEVVEVGDAEISSFPLGGNVPYKPGKRLVKLQTDPKVYAVDDGGVLRWVKNEKVARMLYGENWNTFVDDLSDAFFANYTVGEDIDEEGDFDAMKHALIKSIKQTLHSERVKRHGGEDDGHRGYGKDKVAVCKGFDDHFHTIYVAEPAVPAHVKNGATVGACAGDQDDDNDDDEDEDEDGDEDGDEDEDDDDDTAPTVSDIGISDITDDSATVSFHTSEDTKAMVYYSTASPVNLGTAGLKTVMEADDDHDVVLTGLHADTTYYVVIVVKDVALNMTTTSEHSFTTDEEDDTAPVVSDVEIDDITDDSATVSFHTDEDTTAVVYYSTASPVDLDTAGSKAVTVADDEHEVSLTDLHDETTYYVVIVVKDAALNMTTTSEHSFTTLLAS